MPATCRVIINRLAELLNSVRPLKIMRNSRHAKSANKKQYRIIRLFALVKSREFIAVPGASD